MSEAASALAEARPYHHGDLRRALVEAARRILETEGPNALSLRAVAREAGVSPAAPYHHFKDKGELLDAIAQEGYHALTAAMAAARNDAGTPPQALTELGVAYVCFARRHPALYRVMSDCNRDKASMHKETHEAEEGGFSMVRNAMIAAGVDASSEIDLELAAVAAWCAAHGVAEMIGFTQFEPLKDLVGGEENLIRAILTHVGMFGDAARGAK